MKVPGARCSRTSFALAAHRNDIGIDKPPRYIMNTLYALAQSSKLFLMEASPRKYVKDILVKRHCPSIFSYALS